MPVLEASVVLALLAALCFSVQVIVIERALARAGPKSGSQPVIEATLVTIAVSTVIFWLLVAVRPAGVESATVISLLPFVLVGLGYPTFFRLLYFEGIDRVGGSVSAAIVGVHPAVAIVLAVPLLGETVTAIVGVGVVILIVGVVVLQLTQRAVSRGDGTVDTVTEKLSTTAQTDLLYPAGAMVVLGSAYVAIRYGLTFYSYPIVATAVTQTTALVALVAYLLVRPQMRTNLAVRASIPTLWYGVAGVLLAIAWIAQFFALQIGTVVRVVPILNTQPLLVLLLSYGLARQFPRSRRVVVAILLIVLGATLVQL